MLNHKIFKDCFPVHDGCASGNENDNTSLIRWLHYNWAQYSNIFKFQPIQEIRNYFGEKIAFYFVFLGFYTCWLIPCSIFGLFVFIHGLRTMNNDTYVRESCDLNYNICPSCDSCNFTNLDELCYTAKFTYVFANMATVAYSFLISVLAVVFLEFWKRKNADLAYEWDEPINKSDDLHDQPIRCEYIEAACQEKEFLMRKNPLTGGQEPHVGIEHRLHGKCLSIFSLLFAIVILLTSGLGCP